MNTTWTQLIEATSNEIHLMARDLALPDDVLYYARVLSAHLQGDLEKLAELSAAHASEPIGELAQFRLGIRRRDLTEKQLHRFGALQFESVFEGERHFCLGSAWEAHGNEAMAFAHYHRAAAAYRLADCPRKSLRALYNSVCSESRLRPHKNLISEYQAVIEAARLLGDTPFEGAALGMLSREYQIAGLLDQALAMAEKSVERLECERGTVHYYHCLLHKAHVLIDQGRESEVPLILRECEMAPFPAIQAARTLLSVRLDPGAVWNRALECELLPTWKNRVPALLLARPAIDSAGTASELETALLRLAYNGPVEKWDLIARLYPGESDSLMLENRFKNLVARVRKKYPDLLGFKDGRYSVLKLPALLELT